MLIGKVQQDPKRNVSHSLRESLLERLEAYRELYHATYGSVIDRSELIERLLAVALDRDREFRRHERARSRETRRDERGADARCEASRTAPTPPMAGIASDG